MGGGSGAAGDGAKVGGGLIDKVSPPDKLACHVRRGKLCAVGRWCAPWNLFCVVRSCCAPCDAFLSLVHLLISLQLTL